MACFCPDFEWTYQGVRQAWKHCQRQMMPESIRSPRPKKYIYIFWAGIQHLLYMSIKGSRRLILFSTNELVQNTMSTFYDWFGSFVLSPVACTLPGWSALVKGPKLVVIIHERGSKIFAVFFVTFWYFKVSILSQVFRFVYQTRVTFLYNTIL